MEDVRTTPSPWDALLAREGISYAGYHDTVLALTGRHGLPADRARAMIYAADNGRTGEAPGLQVTLTADGYRLQVAAQ